MTTDDIHRLYELEAQIDQAIQIMLNLAASVKAMKPPVRHQKMTKDDVIAEFRNTRMSVAKGSRNSR